MIGEANELRSLHPEMKKIYNLRQSHYREVPRWEILYETRIEILAGFGPVGITEKKNRADYVQLLRPFFSCFHGQKKDKKHCIDRPHEKVA